MQIGPYTVVEELGRGSMGVVYRARHDALDRDVALKVLQPPPEAVLGEWFRRVAREAQAAGRLAGTPGIVGVHDRGEHDGLTYLVMEYVPGRSLDAELESECPAPREAARLIAAAARAVQAAHDAGILHRDLKPANLLVDRHRQPWVTDFGLTTATAADPETTRLTRQGAIIGTPHYMPPEQALGRPADPRSDVYALGATLFHTVTGTTPFDGPNMAALINAVLHEPAPRLRTRTPEAPVALEAVVARCLAKDPADRYPTAEALAQDLEAVASGRDAAVARAPAARSRRPAVLAAVLLGAAALAGGGWWLQRAAQTARERLRAAGAGEQLQAAALRAGDTHRLLATHSLDAVRLLEGYWAGAPLDDARRDAALLAVRQAAETARAAHAPAPLADAWEQWSAILAARDDDFGPLRRLVRRDDAGPMERVLGARAALVQYARLASDLPPTSLAGDIPWPEVAETPVMAALREQANRSLARALESPYWGRVDHARAVQAFAAGAAAFSAGDWAAADRALRPLADEPLFEDPARSLLAISALRREALGDAIDWWTPLAARGRPDAQAGVALACTLRARRAATNGRDARPALREAASHFAAAVAGPRASDGVRYQHCLALLRLAEAESRAGDRAPGPHRAAMEAGRALAARLPENGAVWNLLASAWLGAAAPFGDAGDPDGPRALAEALAAADTAIRLEPGELAFRLNRVRARTQQAWAAYATGGETRELLERAQADCVALLDVDAPLPAVQLAMGSVLTLQATMERDPQTAVPRLRRAVEHGRAALAAMPGSIEAARMLNDAGTRLVVALADAGIDPEPAVADALAAADQAIASAPRVAELHNGRAGLLWRRAQWRLQQGRPPGDDLTGAIAAFGRALELDPGSRTALMGRALARRLQGQAGPPAHAETAFQAALEDFAAAERLQPDDVSVPMNRAHVWFALAQIRSARGADPRAAAEAGIADCTAALHAMPSNGEVLALRAALYTQLAFARLDAGQSYQHPITQALADYAAAATHAPHDWRARVNHGQLLLQLQRPQDALDVLEHCLRINPDAPVQELLAQARRALGR